ncbi:sugar ABC transporter permease [Paenibacillus psychroresistens]|uniref:Sugar ABC transporter permease n=1 Tax=Paenibacillus psychroresistens TaxID=1778678 RepID=A0A6B8RU23_9BACL|nr:sugar ABC transporter permease [Paenibacillus psychroresistens]QGQ98678.1 sugar ABC transporter permease [Paenibacillus psychroresistens]
MNPTADIKPKAFVKARSKLHYKTSITGILFLIPALVMIAYTIFIPTVWNFMLSFQKWDGFKIYKWIGLKNYKDVMADETTRISLYHSVYIAVLSTVVAVIIGVMLAAFIYRLGKKEGAVYRLILFMPSMLPLAIIGLLFSFMFSPEMGLINQFLRLIGAGALATAWLENSHTVLLSIIAVGIWRIAGLTMMLCFAAMQSIPISLFESSKLDGATYFKQWIHIVLPLIKPIIQLSVIFTLVLQFKTYDLVFVMTGGGPGSISKTIPLHMIDTAFTFNEFGASAAMGFLLTIIVMLFIVVFNRILKGEQYEY